MRTNEERAEAAVRVLVDGDPHIEYERDEDVASMERIIAAEYADVFELLKEYGPDYCDKLQQDIDERNVRIAELEQENERLRAIVDKLPKTADGVTAIPGMTVYAEHNGVIAPCRVELQGKAVWPKPAFMHSELKDCHSSRTAAEQAKEKEKT